MFKHLPSIQPVIHTTDNVDDFVLCKLLFKVHLVNDLTSQVILMFDDRSTALAITIAAHSIDNTIPCQGQCVSAS